jgi:hypothetical protein
VWAWCGGLLSNIKRKSINPVMIKIKPAVSVVLFRKSFQADLRKVFGFAPPAESAERRF